MVPDLTVASFYTPTWKYPAHADRLRSECERLKLPYHIDERPDAGDYLANTRIKPRFLCETMDLLQRPLLWIDVDGSILKRPDAIRGDVDFMARPMPEDRRRQWHVGTLYFNATPAARQLLRLWAEWTVSGSDEASLDAVWRHGPSDHVGGLWPGTWAPLPAEYFEILSGRNKPKPSTVICHRLSRSPSKLKMHARSRAERTAR